MTTVLERVKTALSNLSPAVPFAYEQYLTANGADLPSAFIVFFDVADDAAQHADNVETHRLWRIQVSYYSRAGAPVFDSVDTVMLAAGFSKGSGGKLPFDEQTLHFGRRRDYYYLDT
ncbi:MAG: hypothetical protein HY867_06080 [Chloroflexi bacterium]|nr:hypothetical protein [Chloroflexota bacterium]